MSDVSPVHRRTLLAEPLIEVEDAHRGALLDQRPDRRRAEAARSARDKEGLRSSATQEAISDGVAATRRLLMHIRALSAPCP